MAKQEWTKTGTKQWGNGEWAITRQGRSKIFRVAHKGREMNFTGTLMECKRFIDIH